MDQFESYLQYQKEVTEFKLKTINRFQKGIKPELKRTSKIDTVRNVLNIAGRPLHVTEIIQLAKRDFEVDLDRDSIVSAILKKVKAGKSFIRTSPNTFALKVRIPAKTATYSGNNFTTSPSSNSLVECNTKVAGLRQLF